MAIRLQLYWHLIIVNNLNNKSDKEKSLSFSLEGHDLFCCILSFNNYLKFIILWIRFILFITHKHCPHLFQDCHFLIYKFICNCLLESECWFLSIIFYIFFQFKKIYALIFFMFRGAEFIFSLERSSCLILSKCSNEYFLSRTSVYMNC